MLLYQQTLPRESVANTVRRSKGNCAHLKVALQSQNRGLCGWQAFVDRWMARLLPWLRLGCVEVGLGLGETFQ